MANTPKQLIYKAYKDDGAFFGTAGAGRPISCNHQNLGGTWYINNAGEVTLLETTTIPLATTANNYVHGVNYVPAAQITNDPHRFSDTNFKAVYKIYDYANGLTTYVDITSYDAIIVGCSQVPYPSICGLIPSLVVTPTGATTATAAFSAGTNAVVYEWVVQSTPSTQPVIAGTISFTSPILITGLVTSHAYRFWIRTICGGSLQSAWQSKDFTTL